ncbi:protein NLRC5-like [Nilaparvata lugens]|uniref:protein NLRC5-like n=1 Tax=Nilaparvata lugens TaxID=108931 RepID=UPI00193D1693|nr:protein NLRC5-like [Nilaparvata lugens]
MEQLCDGLRSIHSLEMLDLSTNLIGDEGSTYISEYLLTKPPLKALNLSHNRIGNKGADSLARCLVYSDLKYLDVSFNQIKDSAIQFLLYNIPKQASKRLLLFFLRGNEIKDQETLSVLQILIDAKIINSETCDLTVYKAYGDEHLSLAHNQMVDIFREEYYSVSKETDNFKQQSIREKNTRKHIHFVSSWPMPLSIVPEFGTPFID